MFMNKLEGKVILVTGAGRGFGRYMCLAFAKEGATVVAASRTTSELDKLKKDIESKAGKCDSFSIDLLNYDDMIRLRDHIVNNFRRLDVLVNSAADNLWSFSKKQR